VRSASTARHFVEMARAYSGCEVWLQDFVHLDLPAAMFDGIFANAALFHVPSVALPKVLDDLYGALKPGGVLFSSNPRGHNEEGWNGDRSVSSTTGTLVCLPLQAVSWNDSLLSSSRFAAGPATWLASVWRKPNC
jgi:SAM-dependent methyltransferase